MNRTDDILPVLTVPKKSYLKWTLLLMTITLVLFVIILVGVIVAMATATNTAVFGFETFVFICMLVAFILLGLVTYATKFIYNSKYPYTNANQPPTTVQRKTTTSQMLNDSSLREFTEWFNFSFSLYLKNKLSSP